MNATERILRHASQLGFDDCAVARCHPLNSQRETFEEWLEHGYDGSLGYLRRHVAKRFDPSLLVEGARSVIVCAVSYHRPLSEGDIPSRIASYAHSRDYHLTLREKLAELLVLVRELYPDSEGRAFTDTAPIVEKAWAAEAGLGWIGRNSLLIHPRLGSFVLLGEIVTTAELDAGRPCPTAAETATAASTRVLPEPFCPDGESTLPAASRAGPSNAAKETKASCTDGFSAATCANGPVRTTAGPRSPRTRLFVPCPNWSE